jgi:hypothetical protein
MRLPHAYIRRSSRSRSDPGDISREFQTETVRALAERDANLVILDGDWGKFLDACERAGIEVTTHAPAVGVVRVPALPADRVVVSIALDGDAHPRSAAISALGLWAAVMTFVSESVPPFCQIQREMARSSA